MSWTALILAGAVIGQLPPLPSPVLQDAPLASTQPGGAEPAATGSPQAPAGGYGTYGTQPVGAQPTTPSDWRGSAAAGAAQPTGSTVTQPGQPGPADGMPSGTGASDPFSKLPLSTQRIFELERLHRLQADAKAAAARNAEAPVPPPVTEMPRYAPKTSEPPPYQASSGQFQAIPRLTAEEMLEQAMTLPPSTAISGRRVTLLDVVGQVTDRSKRIEIAHAYWQLARKLGEYRSCWEESQQIQSIRLQRIDSTLQSPAQQAADRELTAAELALLQAQYFLAEAAGLDIPGQLPLPGDRPHLSTYKTHFEQIFVDRSPPGQTRLIHRILPLQHQVIEVRGDAVRAAQDALQAVDRSYWAGQVDAADLLAALHETTIQRRAWITAVARYNQSIADYALAVAGPETTGRSLVSILIKLSQVEPANPSPEDAAGPKIPGEPTLAPPRDQVTAAFQSQGLPPVPVDPIEAEDMAVAPAVAVAPVTTDGGLAPAFPVTPAVAEAPVTTDGGRPLDSAVTPTAAAAPVPTPADPYGAVSNEPKEVERQTTPNEEAPDESLAKDESVAEAEENAEEQDAVAGDAGPSETFVEKRTSEPAPSEPQEAPSRTAGLVIHTGPMVAVEKSGAAPTIQTVLRPPSGALPGQSGDPVALSAGVQAKRLTTAFHGRADSLRPAAQAIDLEASLDGVARGRRRAVIEAYWEASRRVAEYEIYRRHSELLDGLFESVTLGAAGTADARARLEVAQFDAKANLLEAENRLLATQHELTRRCGRPLDRPWLVPSTLPHAGDYRLHLESQSAQIMESWTLQRLAAIIPALSRSLKDRAVAVIDADSRRTQTVTAYRAETLPFDRVLLVVDQQTDECLEFVNVLAAYNQSIADYVTAVVPETLPEKQLVATLVVR